MTNLRFRPYHGQRVVGAWNIRPQQVMGSATAPTLLRLRVVRHLHRLEDFLDRRHLCGKFYLTSFLILYILNFLFISA